jgi:hypothetical protein
MSRLANRIRHAGSSAGRAIGFAAAAGKPPRAIVVVAPATSTAEVTAAIEAGADAIAYSGPSGDLAAAVEAASHHALGVILEAASGDDVQAAADAGADFFIFDDAASSPAALRVEGVGRVLMLGDDQSEDTVRLLAGVSLDAVLIEGVEVTSIRSQLALRQLATWAQAPLLAATDSTDTAQLTALRDAGAPAILARGDLAATLAAADEVRPPQRTQGGAQPLVPPPHAEVHDHDDEDF